MNPEEKLRQEAALARAAIGKGKARAEKLSLWRSRSGFSTGFDADLGLDTIRLADGSIRYAATNTNGARGIGQEMLVNQGQGMTSLDAMPTVKTPGAVPIAKKPARPSTKILFSIEYIDGADYVADYYICGDRPTPTKIASISSPLNSLDYSFDSFITNTGTKQSDFIFASDWHLINKNSSFGGRGLYTIVKNEPIFLLSDSVIFNDIGFTDHIVPSNLGYGVWRADTDLNEEPRHNRHWSIFKDLVYTSDSYQSTGSDFLLPDPGFARPQSTNVFLYPLLTNELKDRLIILVELLDDPDASFEIDEYRLITKEIDYTITNFDEELRTVGATWIKDKIYIVKLPFTSDSLTASSVELEAVEFKVSLQNNTATLLKKEFKIKLPSLGLPPINPDLTFPEIAPGKYITFWGASYYPGK